MLVIRDRPTIYAGTNALADPELRRLIHQSADQLMSQFEPGEYSLEELGVFIVVESGDSIDAIDEQLGRSILDTRPELVLEHPGWYQLVFILSDDGYGVEVFVPKDSSIPPDLIALCRRYAVHLPEGTDQ